MKSRVYKYNYIGTIILFVSASGLVPTVALLVAFNRYCDLREVLRPAVLCETAQRNPPWLLVSGLAAVPSLLLTWYWRTKQKFIDIENVTEGQLTDRYTKAIDHLGRPEPNLRLGAIYALERLAHDSPRDHWTIMEVLTAFVRNKDNTKEPHSTIQAALTVIGRRNLENEQGEERKLDLSRTDLQGFSLRSAHLASVDLRHSNLSSADLSDAILNEALLDYSILSGAICNKAHFEKAQLAHCNLRHARLWRTKFNYANLSNADLRGSHDAPTNLREAELTEVRFDGASYNQGTSWPVGFAYKTSRAVPNEAEFPPIESVSRTSVQMPARELSETRTSKLLSTKPILPPGNEDTGSDDEDE